jgi:hypothetical protein
MLMMHTILQEAAAGGSDPGCPLVAALSELRPWTPANVRSMMRLADLLAHVSSARSALKRLLKSAVWEEACTVALPLAGHAWGSGVMDAGAALLEEGGWGRGR